ncbi:hypothetical protein PEX1_004810 [Penicillium expansum]|uniref:Uncharacterized protein n=1 Tax=Penicillium expansum TaxID=27334 RepID=A0A0A2JZ91_PENEN|nr:hypothetical protein PEX2_032750 [Penicillium expansum]KGO41627.1 hypothetical protein PEXP_088510 [Penicillium expansum]KGO60136.1 hypothetical protein PEX2_032750 [Penicillium expansum]KGO61398.1 hypothetical protein PEX1_004810 [Penicillium expansum]
MHKFQPSWQFRNKACFSTQFPLFRYNSNPARKRFQKYHQFNRNKRPCGWLRGSGMVGVFLLFRVSLASEQWQVKEQLTKVSVAQHKS